MRVDVSVDVSVDVDASSRATSAVQVVIVPPGADAQALAQLVGSKAYTVDAPTTILEDVRGVATERNADAVVSFGS